MGQRSTGLRGGTVNYGAPDLHTERTVFTGPYGLYVDLWSLGARLYRPLTCESPFWRNSGGTYDIAEPNFTLDSDTVPFRRMPRRQLTNALPERERRAWACRSCRPTELEAVELVVGRPTWQ